MKFEDVKVGMLVSVTGKYASDFPNGAEVIETDSMDDSIKIRNRETGRTMSFFDNERSAPSIFCNKYPMKDIHPLSLEGSVYNEI